MCASSIYCEIIHLITVINRSDRLCRSLTHPSESELICKYACVVCLADWLDVGNNKKALQEIEKVLKKSPSLQCARALRCLATWRLGREREALGGLGALAADLPADDATLQVMTICYRESQQCECLHHKTSTHFIHNSVSQHVILFLGP